MGGERRWNGGHCPPISEKQQKHRQGRACPIDVFEKLTILNLIDQDYTNIVVKQVVVIRSNIKF